MLTLGTNLNCLTCQLNQWWKIFASMTSVTAYLSGILVEKLEPFYPTIHSIPFETCESHPCRLHQDVWFPPPKLNRTLTEADLLHIFCATPNFMTSLAHMSHFTYLCTRPIAQSLSLDPLCVVCVPMQMGRHLVTFSEISPSPACS